MGNPSESTSIKLAWRQFVPLISHGNNYLLKFTANRVRPEASDCGLWATPRSLVLYLLRKTLINFITVRHSRFGLIHRSLFINKILKIKKPCNSDLRRTLENLLRIHFSTTVDRSFEYFFMILLSSIFLCLSTTLIALLIHEHFIEHFLLFLTR